MPGEATTLFWDIGGVLLSNGWDTDARAGGIARFELDGAEFERRHAATFPAYEAGQISLSAYLDDAVFWRARSFSKEEFQTFMLAQSTEKPESRAVLDAVTASRRYLMGTVNNEGRELNEFRIDKFGLKRNFSVFVSSCYVGLRKPAEPIYLAALGITQRRAGECVFIDDREENLAVPRRLGMRAVHFKNAAQLRADLAAEGVALAAG